MSTASVFGASGLIGRQLTEMLCMDKHITKVYAGVRTSLQIPHPTLHEVIVNFNMIDAYPVLFESDYVFCCLGTTIRTTGGDKEAFKKVDYSYPVQIAQCCKKYGTHQLLIVSALGADEKSSIFYNRVKGEMESTIKNIMQESTAQQGLHFFQPSLLNGVRRENRTSEKIAQIVMQIFNPLMIGRFRKYRSINSSDVAKAMMHTAFQNANGVHTYTSDVIQKIADKYSR